MTLKLETLIEDVESCPKESNKIENIHKGHKQPLARNIIPESRSSINECLWRKIEKIIDLMESEELGINVRNIKNFMSIIPSVFTGSDIIQWLMRYLEINDISEAMHVANRISAAGYIFCIDDHILSVKNDSHIYYRFQTPFFYPSRNFIEVDSVDYAVYLSKRTMQNKHRLELADYEAERLATLQNSYCHRWEFIYIQAESETKVDKKRDKVERLVLESQERAFWDVHRPAPGCVNTTEIDMRKLCKSKRPKKVVMKPLNFPLPIGENGSVIYSDLNGLKIQEQIIRLTNWTQKNRIKASQTVENLMSYSDQYIDYDMLLNGFSIVNSSMFQASNVLINQQNSNQSHHHHQSCSNSSSGPRLSEKNTSNISSSSQNVRSVSTYQTINRTGSSGGINLHGILTSSSGNELISSESVLDAGINQNPWISENHEYWNSFPPSVKLLPIRRVKKWAISFSELLKDTVGKEEFRRWLEKEYSAENLKFWEQCQKLKSAPLKDLYRRINDIFDQFLSTNALEPLNVDSYIQETIRNSISLMNSTNCDRYIFELAEEHIFQLMKSDSYNRFLRSDIYKEYFSNVKKKSKKNKGTISSTNIGSGSFSVLGQNNSMTTSSNID